MNKQMHHDFALEAVINRVQTTLSYLWPRAKVEAHQDLQNGRIDLVITTYHGRGKWSTSMCTDAWAGRYDDAFYAYLMKELPVRHAVELTRVAINQAREECFTTHKSEDLRDYASYPRP